MLFFPLQLTGDCIKSDIKKYKKKKLEEKIISLL